MKSVHALRQRGGARGRGGFSLLDVSVAVFILVVAIGSLSSAVIASLGLSRSNEEGGLANAAARRMAEQLEGTPFRDVFVLYDSDPDDDPAGAGTAPGAAFDVRGLTPQADDPDGRVGRILFPVVATGVTSVALREDVFDESLGMPRDLNLDGDQDLLDHAGDYRILPVTIRIEWSGASGDRFVEYDLLLMDG